MRRTLLIISALLLLGAAVNIAISWAIAATAFHVFRVTSPPPSGASSGSDVAEAPQVMTGFPLSGAIFGAHIGADFGKAFLAVAPADQPGAPCIIWDMSYGLPARSLSFRIVRQPSATYQVQWGVRLDAQDPYRSLPLHPKFPGFLENTLCYAAALALFVIPIPLRRALRRRRHLCSACAYPIGASPICTECGATLSAPLAANS